jgi:hypothetical protein
MTHVQLEPAAARLFDGHSPPRSRPNAAVGQWTRFDDIRLPLLNCGWISEVVEEALSRYANVRRYGA